MNKVSAELPGAGAVLAECPLRLDRNEDKGAFFAGENRSFRKEEEWPPCN